MKQLPGYEIDALYHSCVGALQKTLEVEMFGPENIRIMVKDAVTQRCSVAASMMPELGKLLPVTSPCLPGYPRNLEAFLAQSLKVQEGAVEDLTSSLSSALDVIKLSPYRFLKDQSDGYDGLIKRAERVQATAIEFI